MRLTKNMQQGFNILVLFLIIFSVFPNLSASAGSLGQYLDSDIEIKMHDETGRASFLAPKGRGTLVVPGAMADGLRPDDRGMIIMNAYGKHFGLTNPGKELRVEAQALSTRDNLVIRYQQMYKGLPVFGGQLLVNMTARGELRSINGEISPSLDVVITPEISANDAIEQALQVVARTSGISTSAFNVTTPELWIFDGRLVQPSAFPAELVWRMEVSNLPQGINELVLVNAETGGISLHFNQIDTQWRMDKAVPDSVVFQASATPEVTQTSTLPPATETPTPVFTATVEPSGTVAVTATAVPGTETSVFSETPVESVTATLPSMSATPVASETPTAILVETLTETVTAQALPYPASLVLISGDQQTGAIGSDFAMPLQVLVQDQFGNPLPDQIVIFTLLTGDVGGAFVDTGTGVTSVISEDDGTAVSSLFGTGITAGSVIIEARLQSTELLTLFNLTVFEPIPPTEIVDEVSIEQALPNSVQRLTYTASNGTTLPGTLMCGEVTPACPTGTDTHVDAAHAYAGDTYNYFWTNHGRNSIDDAGMSLISTTHYDVNYWNAFWSGSQMVYGDGAGFALADDVVGHELTHGVTDYTANLYYYYQSGAINESLSDVFGEFVDLGNGAGTDTAGVRWLVGEDVAGMGALRDMKDPTVYSDPDKMTSAFYHLGDLDARSFDNGGVHYNSGVNNKAVFLMVDGGAFNGYTVTGIGIPKVSAIYYYVLSNLLTSGSDYKDLYYAIQQACTTLVGGSEGITAGDCTEVSKALDAVEMSLEPTINFNLDVPNTCAGGYTRTGVFADDLESVTANWGVGNFSGSNTWFYSSYYVSSGGWNIHGVDTTASNDSYIYMANNVSIPSTGETYLHFNHAFGFEADATDFYDGGWLEYSINGGTSWADAGGFYAAGEDYGGTLFSSNPNSGQAAFVADSHGYVSSKYDISALAGNTQVRFRWRVSTDAFVSERGWFVDDVEIYNCETTKTELVRNTSYETVIPNYWGQGKFLEITDGQDCTQAHTGSCSWFFDGNGTGKVILSYYAMTGTVGDTVDLSIWRKALSAAAPGGMVARVVFIHNDGSKDIFTQNLATGDHSQWEQFTNIFTATENYSMITLSLIYGRSAGTLWFDDISLVLNSTTELVRNTSFETVIPNYWGQGKFLEISDGNDCTAAHSGSCSWHFDGNGANKVIFSYYAMTGLTGDKVDLSVWRKALNAAAPGAMTARVVFIHNDGSKDIYTLNLATGDHSQWEQFSSTFIATEDYSMITLSVIYGRAAGMMWFDDISLQVYQP